MSTNYYSNQKSVFHLAQVFYSSIENQFSYGLPIFFQRGIALLGFIAVLPFLAVVSLLIKLESRGSVIYTQTRVGHKGKLFKIYKFRSMYLSTDPKYVDPTQLKSDRDGVCKKFFHDPRITKVGRIIRKLSIDELPQLWNIVRGDMMLVGPRPALPSEVQSYNAREKKRLDVLPGLTGLWQVSGRADTTFEQQIDLDLSYVKNKSFYLDVKILFLTVPAVLMGKGAY